MIYYMICCVVFSDCKPRIHSVESVFRVIEMAQFSAGKNPPWAREPACESKIILFFIMVVLSSCNWILVQKVVLY